ncbi:MAG TPA: PqqD family protein [Burkholderiales bacterium]
MGPSILSLFVVAYRLQNIERPDRSGRRQIAGLVGKGGIVGVAIRRDDAVMVREIDGEVLILDGRTDRIHKLNRTASFIWRRCEEGATAEGIASALAGEFAVHSQTALADVLRTLDELRSLDLLATA